MASPALVRTREALRATIGRWRADGRRIALVPTMGALHDGHLSLIERARDAADKVVVSIFVNPAQFAPGEDFDAYPRDEDRDLALLDAHKADLAYIPDAAEIYPDGFATTVSVAGLTDELCGAHREGHFDGVTTVVTKLLTQAMPDVAVFGEKDYQQLLVIRRLVRDLDLPVEILGAPLVREEDGLALSSRNAYLSAKERAIAAELSATLFAIAAALRDDPAAVDAQIAQGREKLEEAGFDSIDYLDVRSAEDLTPLRRADRPARVFAAVRIGRTRLIDNVPVEPSD